MANSLKEEARVDYDWAKLGLTVFKDPDDAHINRIGYHLQQSVERSLKAILEHTGFDYRAVGHSISKAYRSVLNHAPHALSQESQDFIEEYADTLTLWEKNGRYPTDYLFTLRKMIKICPCVGKLLEEADAFCSEDVKKETQGIKRTRPLDFSK